MKAKLLLIIIFFASINVRGQWTTINSGTTTDLKQIVFTDSLTGYILGIHAIGSMNSELLKTTDGGYNWSVILSNPWMNVFDFLNSDTGVVLGSQAIYKSFDGGSSWTAISSLLYPPKLLHMNTVDEWFGIGTYTTDGGTTWNSGDTTGSLPIVPTDFQFVNDTTVIGVGWYGAKTVQSIDKGLHWKLVSVFPLQFSNFIWSCAFPTATTGLVTSSNGILKSVDGGINWTRIDSTLGFDIYCLRHLDSNHFYGVGYGGGIAKTSDGGNSWTTDVSGTTRNLNKIVFINSHQAIAIGDSGTILMDTNIAAGIENVMSNKNVLIISPNPLTSFSTLQLSTQLKDAEVVISDMLGKEMVRKKLTGNRMEIERGSLVSGVYFVKVRDGERQWVGKVVVE